MTPGQLLQVENGILLFTSSVNQEHRSYRWHHSSWRFFNCSQVAVLFACRCEELNRVSEMAVNSSFTEEKNQMNPLLAGGEMENESEKDTGAPFSYQQTHFRIVGNGQRKISSTQEGHRLLQADHQVGRLPFRMPGSNEEKQGASALRQELPSRSSSEKVKCIRRGLVSTSCQATPPSCP